MERLEHLIATFREEHPDVDATVLLDFAKHVRRVLLDELRDDAKADETTVAVSVQLHGQSFSAKGPKWYVDSMLTAWSDAASKPPTKNVTPSFNRMRLISGGSR